MHTHPHHPLLAKLLDERHGISPERLLPTARLRQDLSLDSLDLQLLALDLETVLEDEHQIEWEITDPQVNAAITYTDLLNLLPTAA